MRIRELTQKKQIELEEGISSEIGDVAGQVVSGVKNVGSAIVRPFKDIAQGYSTARQDQKVSAVADKAFRAWQKYVSQLEQSIAVQPASATASAKTTPGTTAPAGAAAPGVPAKTPPGTTQPNTMANAPVSATNKAVAGNANATTPATTSPPPTAGTVPTKPNYGAQTGGGATVKYNQPTGVPTPLAKTPQPTSPNMVQPPATVASTAPGQPITVGGQKIKPGQPGYDQLAKATLKE